MKQGLAIALMTVLIVAAITLIWFNVAYALELREEVDQLEDQNNILIEENVHLKDYLEKNT